MENDEWDWRKKHPISEPIHVSKLQLNPDELVDDVPVRDMRSLFEIYQSCNVALLEPSNFWEAAKDSRWVAAMEEEISMIEKNQTWQLMKRPGDRKVIGVKWVFRTKLNHDGSINKHKLGLL
ncbi:hypothetical protein Syun_020724 [Stephania yunnanensis]|uniref:Mitochondrial protein n=1 Tax=Stephania yunnanensis TaxID=152371 RepID=A0AAP0IG95_9MAGN